mgnify:CR=1 FL=1
MKVRLLFWKRQAGRAERIRQGNPSEACAGDFGSSSQVFNDYLMIHSWNWSDNVR